jgi:hypothetical protein
VCAQRPTLGWPLLCVSRRPMPSSREHRSARAKLIAVSRQPLALLRAGAAAGAAQLDFVAVMARTAAAEQRTQHSLHGFGCNTVYPKVLVMAAACATDARFARVLQHGEVVPNNLLSTAASHANTNDMLCLDCDCDRAHQQDTNHTRSCTPSPSQSSALPHAQATLGRASSLPNPSF